LKAADRMTRDLLTVSQDESIRRPRELVELLP